MSKFQDGDIIEYIHRAGTGDPSGDFYEVIAGGTSITGARGNDYVADGYELDLHDDCFMLIERPVKESEPIVVPSVDIEENRELSAQLDRIERLLRFEVNRFYGVVMDEDGTFRKVGILPEYSSK